MEAAGYVLVEVVGDMSVDAEGHRRVGVAEAMLDHNGKEPKPRVIRGSGSPECGGDGTRTHGLFDATEAL